MGYRKLFSSKYRRAGGAPSKAGDASPSSKASRSVSLESDATLVASGEPRPPTTGLVVRPVQRAPSRASDPLGLSLLHSPGDDSDPIADLIFVHGLGGSSRLSWCMDHDLDRYWPLRWLPNNPSMRRTRIFAFGYNADFRSSLQSPTLGISDFAKTLLFDMLYGRDQDGKSFELGQRPIVFVTHSMGGLVFKKAYIDAQLDGTYTSLSQSIRAVVFLSTPHRGSDLAEVLNRVLSVSFRHSKQYVTELGKNGFFLRAVNEQFRHIAPRLQIFSFYETLKTSIGLSSTMILGEDSAKLDYPGEISRPLNADHHGVCKFDTEEHPNYKAVLGVLVSLISSYSDNNASSLAEEMQTIRSLLDIPEDPERDLNHFWGRRAEGTCDWILEQPNVLSWASSSGTSEVLWLTGRPGRGKSTLASFLVHHLRENGAAVQHFFFRGGDETKRSLGALLRIIAFQIAVQFPLYRKALVKLARGGYKPSDVDWKTVWKRLYLGLLFKMESYVPFHWVIDALDESGSGQHILELLGDIRYSSTPIRLVVTSRSSPVLSAVFDRISSKLPSSSLSIDQSSTDIHVYVEDELRYMGWDPLVKEEVKSRILEQANCNFLWVHLILEEIKECYSDDDVRTTLSELPSGMEPLYRRMETSIVERIRRPADKRLSRQIFLWATYSRQPIAVEELISILEVDFGRILDMTGTITRLCGHFVVIEGDNKIGLLHQTAREYLAFAKQLPFSLDEQDAHKELFQRSLSVFIDKSLRSQLPNTPESHKLLQYRATSWLYHLRTPTNAKISSDQVDTLVKFFSDTAFLTWVQALASLGQLDVLIEASRRLDIFNKENRASDKNKDGYFNQLGCLNLLNLWSRDLLRLPARFGSALSLDPEAIHRCVAPFCPQNSAIYKTFGTRSSILKVKRGLPEDWDACLARLFIGNDHPVSLLCCSGHYLAVINSIGTLSVWDCTTYHLVHTMPHGESVSHMTFSAGGDRIATYGARTTRVWDPRSGLAVCSIDTPLEMQPLFLEFVDSDTSLMVGSDRRRILRASLVDENPCWTISEEALLDDAESFEGTFLNSPTKLALSPDQSKIVAAYPRFPLTVWSVHSAMVLMRLNRGHASASSPFVKGIAWHPDSEQLIGFFHDSCIFKLDVMDNTYEEIQLDEDHWPSDIRVSPDGAIFAICGVHGSIWLYDYRTFTLLHQIVSEDIITSFCFSQDSRRLLDARQGCCNVWELDPRPELPEATENPTNSLLPRKNQGTEIFSSEVPSSMTLISPKPDGPVAIIANDDGLVELLNYDTECRVQVDHIATRVSIEHVIWGQDNCHFVYSEVTGRITVVHVEPAMPSGWKTSRVARFKPGRQHGGITQLILSPDSTSLLVVFRQIVQLWKLEPSVDLRASQGNNTAGDGGAGRWSAHPLSSLHLLSFTPKECVMYTWCDLIESARWNILSESSKSTAQGFPTQLTDSSNSWNPKTVIETVEKAIFTHSKTHLLLTVTRRTSRRQLQPRLLILRGNIGLTESTKTTELETVPVPKEIIDQIDIPLNILKNERLVFLDKSHGICTWPLKISDSGSRHGSVKRHFFIPRDWLSTQSTDLLLHVTSLGSVICPVKNEVAVINSTIGSEW